MTRGVQLGLLLVALVLGVGLYLLYADAHCTEILSAYVCT